MVQGSQTIQVMMHGLFEQHGPTAQSPHGSAQLILRLQLGEQTIEVQNPIATMDATLFHLQQHLPQGAYLKCCQFCALSLQDFYAGSGLLCYRNVKEQFRPVKHLQVQKVHHPVHRLRKAAFYVQEIYLCPAFEADSVLIRQAQR